MMIIVGLGNPGEKYKNNRHNVGFMFVDYLTEQIQNSEFKIQNCNLKFKINKYLQSEILETAINGKSVILAKPQTFMNNSGIAVKKIVEKFKLKNENLLVVHDDLDILLGKFKIQKGTGPQLHNGIESIEKHLRNKDFQRVRIGVDNRLTENRINGEVYVLQNFTPEEKTTINQTFPKITDSVLAFLSSQS